MLRKIAYVILALSLAALFACSRVQQEEPQPSTQPAAAQPPAAPTAPAEPAAATERQETPQTASAPKKVEARTPATRPGAGSRTAIEPAVPPVQPPAGANVNQPAKTEAAPPAKPAAESVAPRRQVVVTVPAGTRFEIRLLEPVDSSQNQTGDTFKASLDKDLEVDGKVVAPRGSTVLGKLPNVTPPGRVEGKAAMSMTVTSIVVGDTTYAIQANTLSFESEGNVKGDAKKVGIGAGIGAIIGAIAGGGKGAAIGAAVGGGAGAATVLATKGKDVKFGVEERFSFTLRAPLEVRID